MTRVTNFKYTTQCSLLPKIPQLVKFIFKKKISIFPAAFKIKLDRHLAPSPSYFGIFGGGDGDMTKGVLKLKCLAQRKNFPSMTPRTRIMRAAYIYQVGKFSLPGPTADTVVEL